jgi:ATP/maltotriose-dependent transcriptional regulator MalT
MLRRNYEDVDRYQEEARQYFDENELDYWQSMLMGARVLRMLDGGHWRDALKMAQAVLDSPDPAWRSRLIALVVLARVKARTGQLDAALYLDQATQVASEDPAVAAMIWPSRVEAAWLRGDSELALREVTDANTGRLRRTGDAWFDAEMSFWLYLAGGVVDAHAIDIEPYRLAIIGDWHAAACWWDERGCPYEMAVVLATANQPEAVRRAIRVLDQLGAVTPAAYARRRLRALGIDSVPRGPRRSTSGNAAGLTVRELDVLQLVAAGLSNAEVAARLFLSAKTVERHMASIFAKLQVTSRREAVQVATRIGAMTGAQN